MNKLVKLVQLVAFGFVVVVGISACGQTGDLSSVKGNSPVETSIMPHRSK